MKSCDFCNKEVTKGKYKRLFSNGKIVCVSCWAKGEHLAEPIMKNKIKVKCIESFTEYQNNAEKTLRAVVEAGRQYEATLYEPTGEYFTKDSANREFLVGEINADGKLMLEDEFVLVSE